MVRVRWRVVHLAPSRGRSRTRLIYMARIAVRNALLILGAAPGWRHRDGARFVDAELEVGMSMYELMTHSARTASIAIDHR